MHGELERLVHVGAARVDDDLARRVLDEDGSSETCCATTRVLSTSRDLPSESVSVVV